MSSLASVGLGFAMRTSDASAGRRSVSVSSIISYSIDGLSDAGHLEEESLAFPLPPTSSSAERSERSYWSPTTAADSPDLSEAQSSFIAHPALHCLSPKAQSMAQAAGSWGFDDALEGALSFGWLASAIEDGQAPSAAQRPTIQHKESTVTSPISSFSSAPSLHRAFSRMSVLSHSTQATSMHSEKLSPDPVRSIPYFRSVSESRLHASPACVSPLARTVAQAQPDDPRMALLKIWLAAEQAEQSRNKSLPALPTSEPESNKNGRVKAWLGRLRRPSSEASLADDKRDTIREPRVRRTPSIEQVLYA